MIEARNLIEHIDDEIVSNKISSELSPSLHFSDSQDGVTIAQKSLKFKDLSSILQRLRHLGAEMISWKVLNENT
jgi:hypothetical protein